MFSYLKKQKQAEQVQHSYVSLRFVVIVIIICKSIPSEEFFRKCAYVPILTNEIVDCFSTTVYFIRPICEGSLFFGSLSPSAAVGGVDGRHFI